MVSGRENRTHLLTDIHGNTCVVVNALARWRSRDSAYEKAAAHIEARFFLPFSEPLLHFTTLFPPRASKERTSLFPSPSLLNCYRRSALALQPPYQPFTRNGSSGLMADGAIGFLQKRKRSSRKGAIDAIFVTRFVSLSLSISPAFLYALFLVRRWIHPYRG